MKNIRVFCLCLVMIFVSSVYSQQIHISGIVSDADTGEPLVGAIVKEVEAQSVGITDPNGYFNLLIFAQDTTVLSFEYIGYDKKELPVHARENLILNIALNSGVSLQTVEVNAAVIPEESRLGLVRLTPKEIEHLPTLFGEVDVLKALQILPGISGGKEGTSLLHVRGGSPDQNTILLNGIPVYFPAHLGGFLSVFEPRSIQELKVYKGGFPARYGGRLSSVVDIKMKDGNHKTMKKEIGLGILSSRFFIEGPLKKERTSFHLSLRRSFLDLLYNAAIRIIGESDEKVNYNIYDANFKIKHKLDERNRLFFSYYGGGDNIKLKFKGSNPEYSLEERSNISWGNQLAGVRWSHLGKRWVWNNALSFTSFKYGTRSEFERTEKLTNDKQVETNAFKSKILDYLFHSYAGLKLGANTELTVGVNLSRHAFQPKIETFKGEVANVVVDTTVADNNTITYEVSSYAECLVKPAENWLINAGVHSNYYNSIQNQYGKYIVQPRLLVSYLPSSSWKYSASISQMAQPLHLLSNSGGGLPVDLWVPATEKAPIETSWLYGGGIAYQNKKRSLSIQLELYYKTLEHLIAFQEGASFFRGTTDWETKIVNQGKGISYGMEWLIKKKWNKWDVMIAYTLSKHQRNFTELNNGISFPYRYDRRHDLAINLIFSPSENKKLSLLWVYHSGDALSLAQAGFDIFTFGLGRSNNNSLFLNEGKHEAHYYGSRNSFRMPSYHRLDLSWQVEKTLRRGVRKWIVGLYNSYNRINPYYIYFDENDAGERQLYQFGLFPLLPAVTWVRSW